MDIQNNIHQFARDKISKDILQKLEAGNYKTKMLLQVHDELVFDVYKPELETMKTLIKTEMENAFKLSVPLDVEIGLGDNWLEAH